MASPGVFKVQILIRLRCAPNRRAASHVVLKTFGNCENIVVQDVLCVAFAQGIARTTQANFVQPKQAVFIALCELRESHGTFSLIFVRFSEYLSRL